MKQWSIEPKNQNVILCLDIQKILNEKASGSKINLLEPYLIRTSHLIRIYKSLRIIFR